MIGKNQLSDYLSTYINLADPIIICTEPFPAPTINIAGTEINSWVKFNYKKNSSLKEFKEYYEKIFKVNINMIAMDSIILYAEFLGNESLDKELKDIVNDGKNKTITLLCEEEKELPAILLSL